MDQRDQELLDKQLRKLTPARHDGFLVLLVLGMFFAGMTLGGILSARETPAMQLAANDVAGIVLNPGAAPIAR